MSNEDVPSSAKLDILNAWLALVGKIDSQGPAAQFTSDELKTLSLDWQRLRDMTASQDVLDRAHLVRRSLFTCADLVQSMADQERIINQSRYWRGR